MSEDEFDFLSDSSQMIGQNRLKSKGRHAENVFVESFDNDEDKDISLATIIDQLNSGVRSCSTRPTSSNTNREQAARAQIDLAKYQNIPVSTVITNNSKLNGSGFQYTQIEKTTSTSMENGNELPKFVRFNSPWIHCLCIVTFDIEFGQSIESIYPESSLNERERLNVCYSSFPDSNSCIMGSTQFHFRAKISPMTTAAQHLSQPEHSKNSHLKKSDNEETSIDNKNSRRHAKNENIDNLKTIFDRFNSISPPAIHVDDEIVYGFVHFLQQKDSTAKRGYFQKSFVLLTRLPFISLYQHCTRHLGELYFTNEFASRFPDRNYLSEINSDRKNCGLDLLREIYHEISRWPDLITGSPLTLNLTILSEINHVISFYIPNREDKLINFHPNFASTSSSSLKKSFSSSRLATLSRSSAHSEIDCTQIKISKFQEKSVSKLETQLIRMTASDINLFACFESVISDLQLLWEMVLTCEPIIVMAPTPEICSQFVQGLVNLIWPYKYSPDYRPFFTIHDQEFRDYCQYHSPHPAKTSSDKSSQNSNVTVKKEPNVILGVTNPFFAKSLDHWPNVIRLSSSSFDQFSSGKNNVVTKNNSSLSTSNLDLNSLSSCSNNKNFNFSSKKKSTANGDRKVGVSSSSTVTGIADILVDRFRFASSTTNGSNVIGKRSNDDKKASEISTKCRAFLQKDKNFLTSILKQNQQINSRTAQGAKFGTAQQNLHGHLSNLTGSNFLFGQSTQVDMTQIRNFSFNFSSPSSHGQNYGYCKSYDQNHPKSAEMSNKFESYCAVNDDGKLGDQDENVSQLIKRWLVELTQSFFMPLERYLSGLMPAQRKISPFKMPPELPQRFNLDAFLSTLDTSGPQLTTGIKGDWHGLYRKFYNSQNFTVWYQDRKLEIDRILKILHLESILNIDLDGWMRDRDEVEAVDMIIFLRQRMREAHEGKLNLTSTNIQELQTKLNNLIQLLPNDLRPAFDNKRFNDVATSFSSSCSSSSSESCFG